jgi:hypothetical protein
VSCITGRSEKKNEKQRREVNGFCGTVGLGELEMDWEDD